MHSFTKEDPDDKFYLEPVTQAWHEAYSIVLEHCRTRACRCFLDTINQRCIRKQYCPLAVLRRELEHQAPAFYGFMFRQANARAVFEDLARVILEGDDDQKKEAKEKIQELIAFTHVIVFHLLALLYLENEGVPYISSELVKSMTESGGESALSWVAVDQKFKKMKLSVFHMNGWFKTRYRNILSRHQGFFLQLLDIYISALENKKAADLDSLMKTLDKYFFKQQHAGQEMQPSNSH